MGVLMTVPRLWQVQATPLLYASASGHIDVVRMLVDSKADMEARDEVAMLPDAWCVL